MKTKKLFTGLSLLVLSTSLLAQTWLWAKGAGGACSDPVSIATDNSGNIVMAGVLCGTTIFGPDTLTCVGLNYMLVKYDSNGNALWAKQDKSVHFYGHCLGFSVSCDKNGNIYGGGMFTDSIKFDTLLISAPLVDTNSFFIKYSAIGSVLWVKYTHTIGANGQCELFSGKTDDSGYTYITGWYCDTMVIGSDTLKSNSNRKVFIAKYDSNGNEIWLRSSMNLKNAYGYSVALDGNDNIYVSGQFYDTISFGTHSLTNGHNEYGNVFLVKYNSNGNAIWLRSASLPSYESSAFNLYSEDNYVFNATDASGNIYLTGSYLDTIQFGSFVLTDGLVYPYYTAKFGSVYTVKYDSTGSVIWAESAIRPSITSYAVAWALCTDKKKNVYISGTFQDTISFGSLTLTSNSMWSSYLVKLDSNGVPLCGTVITNYNDDWNPVVASKFGDNVFFSGDVYPGYTAAFGNDTVKGLANETAFLAKWTCDNVSVSVNSISNKHQLTISPNPSFGIFKIVGTQNFVSEIEVYNVLGEQVYKETLRGTQGDKVINLSKQPNGVYFYRVLTESGSVLGSGKIIVDR